MNKRDSAQLIDALELAYKALLRVPMGSKFRTLRQPLYGQVLGALSELVGASEEATQNYYETLVLLETKP